MPLKALCSPQNLTVNIQNQKKRLFKLEGKKNIVPIYRPPPLECLILIEWPEIHEAFFCNFLKKITIQHHFYIVRF